MSADRCTVVVNSCDAYSDLWEPFFKILTRCWEIPYPVVLNTEKREFSWPGLRLQVLHAAAGGLSWTARLRGVLQRIETPYVLMLLDDFFMTGPVRQEKISQVLDWMDADPSAACFSFFPTTGNTDPSPYPEFERRPQNGLYRFNAQAGIWRKDKLIDYLCDDEDAWQWENEGNRRSFLLSDGFYSECRSKTPTFPYDYMQHGLIGGRWFTKTKVLFEQYGIHGFPFEKRGFYDPKDWALLPSVASAFEMDSVLYLNTGNGFCEQETLRCKEVRKSGRFFQEYTFKPGLLALRWDPSTHSGFALRKLRIEDQSGRTLSIGSVNGTWVGEDLVFLAQDPWLEIRIDSGTAGVRIEGEAVCPLDVSLLRAAQRKEDRPGLLKWLKAHL